MFFIGPDDVDPLCRGAGLLGSGGGGHTQLGALLLQEKLRAFGPVSVLDLSEIYQEDLLLPLAFMGAPSINLERIPSCKELTACVLAFQERYPEKRLVLLPAEIGGSNALTPLLVAGELQLPVLDGDLIGRAFPKLDIAKAHLMGISCSPAVLGDAFGQTQWVEAQTPAEMESVCRSAVTKMGSSGAVILYAMTGLQAQKGIISGTLSLALAWGKQMAQLVQTRQRAPQAFASESLSGRKVRVVYEGVIAENHSTIQEGFLRGTLHLKCRAGPAKLLYQNEFLHFQGPGGQVSTPDILSLMEPETGAFLFTDSLPVGVSVAVVTLPADPIWYTSQAQNLVQLSAFFSQENPHGG